MLARARGRQHTGAMKKSRLAAAVIAASAVLGLSACAAQSTAVAPVTVLVNDLQGETVKVALNQVVNINTESLAVDSYTAEIADPSVAEFIQGRKDGSAEFNPGLKPLKVGETKVTLTNEQGGIQPLVFTLEVVAAPAGANLGGSGR
jgi:hypothetical protein